MRTSGGLLSLALFILLAPGCTCEQPASPGPGAKQALAPAPAKATATDKTRLPTVKEGAYNVAFVYVGPVGDGGWTYAHDLGRKELEAANKDVHTVYIESVGEGAEAEQVIRGLARKGFDLVVATSFGFMDAVETVAGEFPAVKFLHISGHKDNGKNFGNLFGAMEQMKYLAGIIAGARAKADGKLKLGYIAPFPIPEVIRLGNALALGIRKSCPSCTMEIRWINSWFDPTKEREAADSLLKAGAQVVITGADTSGPLVAAKDQGKWAVGYDSENACAVAPENCLTVPYWRWGPVYVEQVKAMRAGTWKAAAHYLDVPSGIVGLYGFMEGQEVPAGVPTEAAEIVRALLADMQAGKFTPFDLFAGPIKDNAGKEVLAAGKRLSQKDLEGLKGCTVCMSWLVEGIVGQIPKR
jgi:basic membrane protein A and related proteins